METAMKMLRSVYLSDFPTITKVIPGGIAISGEASAMIRE